MCPIPAQDRLINLFPLPGNTDHRRLDANLVMILFDRIVDGYYGGMIANKLANWTIATRPNPPQLGHIGVNTDISQIEWYDGNEWRILGG